MIIGVDDNISVEICFDPADREEGSDDDIRFRIHESGLANLRMFAADETTFLLTAEQAERLALALQEAATESRALPRSVWPGAPRPDLTA